MATILIVDDSAVPRMLLRRILEAAGHQIVEAADGPGALQRFGADHPDMVLLDLVLEEVSGLDVLARLRALDASVPVVFYTADTDPATRATIAAAGARGVLPKPFARDQVLRLLDSVLAPPA